MTASTNNNSAASVHNPTGLTTWQFVCQSKFLLFLTLFSSFLIMGLAVGMLGPSLLELGEQTGSPLSSLVYIFSARSIGFFVGTLVGGFLVDKYIEWGKTFEFLCLVLSFLFTLITPLVPYLPLLAIVCFGQGTALGIIDNITQVLLIRLMNGNGGKEVQPYMQALHAAFGVGAFISPLLISPFLGGESAFIDPLQAADNESENSSGGSAGGNSSIPVSTVRTASGSTTYHYAYFIVCALVVPVATAMFYYMMRDEQPIARLMSKLTGRIRLEDSESSNGGAGYSYDQSDLHSSAGGSGERSLHQIEDHIELTEENSKENEIHLAQLEREEEEEEEEFRRKKLANDDAVLFRPDLSTAKSPSGAQTTGSSSSSAANDAHEEEEEESLHERGGQRRNSKVNLLSAIIPPSDAGMHLSGNGHAKRNGVHAGDSQSPSPSLSPLSPSLSDDTLSPLSASPVEGDGLKSPSAPAGKIDWDKWKMVLLISIFLFLYVGTESGYGGFIFTYGIKQSHLDPTHAAFLNSAFWFSFAVGRLLGIPISLYFTATTMIFSDLLGCILSLLAIIIFHDSLAVLWVGTLFYGLSVASIYPSAINYAESQFKITGKVLSALTIAASSGDAVIPLLMGLSIESNAGPVGMMLLAMAVAVGAAIIFAIIVGFVAPDIGAKGERKRAAAAKRRRKRKAAAAAAAAAAAQGQNHSESADGPDASSVEMTSTPLPTVTSSAKKPSNRSGYAAVDVDDEAEEDMTQFDANGASPAMQEELEEL